MDDLAPWSDTPMPVAAMADTQAIVSQTIAPRTLGRVQFRGTRWRALSYLPVPILAGTVVNVIGRQRTSILIVEPIQPSIVEGGVSPVKI
jgi:membrane protein implicated in regulation of membrane protease activity